MQHTGRKTSLFLAIATAAMFVPSAWGSLSFNATLDPSLTAPEQTAINNALGVVEADITSPNNLIVSIYFTSTASGLGESITPQYGVSYDDYYNAFASVATQADQQTALSSLGTAPTSESAGNPVNGNTGIIITSAEGRNLGFNTPGVVTVTGVSGSFDGEILLNTSITTPGSGPYSLESVAMHEIDEVLGIGGPGSTIGGSGTGPVGDLDLYRYSGPGVRSYTTSSLNQPYFSIDGGNTVLDYFNQAGSGSDYADWGPNATVEVQDAFATPGANPVLGPNEITAFNAIGYDTLAPEPSTLAMISGLLGAIAVWRRARA